MILLDSISFDATHLMLPIGYDEQVRYPKGTDSRPDIEKILDQVAFNSDKFNFQKLNIYGCPVMDNLQTKDDSTII
jgi:hypothetical protein